ncbi:MULTISPECIES: phage tail protein [Providencia]|uniref:phage tail protein n=1 Tax=Providencia TaxID=586 RepID=UPI0013DEF5F0|nr:MULTISPECIES: phage tail protein [unclassified Providencia]QIF56524.1 phage tail protein [Providencia sp. 1701011]QIF60573.1 phage tail protein [Providencia sp. 1701091]
METFNWPVKPRMKTDSSPRTRSVRFGDGYEQRKVDGLNAHLEKFSVNLSLVPEKADQALEFLKRHGGVKSFLFQPIKSQPAVVVVCRKWSSDSGNVRKTISAEFEQVIF